MKRLLLLIAALLFAVEITIPDAAAETPWHLQPMDTWQAGECYRSPNATSYRDDGDYPIQLPEDAPLEDRARAAGYRLSVTEIDSWGRIKPEHQEHWRNALAAAESDQKARAASRNPTSSPTIAEARPVTFEDGIEFGDIARWKAAYEREQARKAKRQAKKNANKSASADDESPFQEVGLFSRFRRGRSCSSCAPAAKSQAPQYRVECNGGSCRRVRVN